MLFIRRCLAICHYSVGILLLLGVLSYIVLGIFGLPQLLIKAHRTHLTITTLCQVTLILLPETALGVWMLILAHWLWSGYHRLRTMLLITHGFLLFIGILIVKWGFYTIEAAERSAAQGGGLLGASALFPFLIGVPLLVFALFSIAVAIWVVPRQQIGQR